MRNLTSISAAIALLSPCILTSWSNGAAASAFSDSRRIPQQNFLIAQNYTFLKEGTLIKGSSKAIYIINAGRRRLIPDEATFKALGYKWENVKQVSDAELNAIAELPAIPSQYRTTLKNGTLVKGVGPSVFVISSGGRRLIPNETTFNALGYKWENIQKLSEAELKAIPEYAPLPIYATSAREGTLMRGSGPAVYVVNAGKRRLIPDEATFNALGFKWENVKQVSDRELYVIPELPAVTINSGYGFRDGTLIRGSGAATYVISSGRRRLIPNEKTFNALGYKQSEVQRISDGQLLLIPELSPLPSY